MINKKLQNKIYQQINVITNLNDKIADFYNKPERISDIRTVIFVELNKLKEMIK